MLNILLAWKAICFYCFVACFMVLCHISMKIFEKALRTFETDADLADHNVRSEVNENPDPALLIFATKPSQLTSNTV